MEKPEWYKNIIEPVAGKVEDIDSTKLCQLTVGII